jgi:hypothetical protein
VVLIPGELRDQTRAALKGIQKIARDTLALEMRCALVPVGAVRAEQRDVKIAYQALGPARKLAMMAGGGIDAAEAIIKSEKGAPFIVNADDATEDADLSGLSCRWKPLQSQRGVMLSIIVRATDPSSALPRAYREVHDGIERAVARNVCPVAQSNLKAVWPPRGADRERAFGGTLFGVYGTSLLGLISERTGITIGGFNGRAYAASLQAHSDYRKFADSLRMVIDCTRAEADGIESILKAAREQNRIEYGLHRASSALMTCFVSSTDDGGHVHFIDGADGGYALAAQELKSQIESKI